MSRSLAVLSTDTPHHRYLINRVLDEGIEFDACLFETKVLEPPVHTKSPFEAEQKRFEEEMFFRTTRKSLDRIRIEEVSSVNAPEGQALLRELSPDFGLVFGAGKLDVSVIDQFRDGLINVHRGIAQEYRGLDSDLWAAYHRDYGNIGVTIHQVEPELDTGDVVGQERLTLTADMRIHQLRYHTTVIASRLVVEAFRNYLDGRLTSEPQGKRGRYYSFMPECMKSLVAGSFNGHCAALEK